MFVSDRAWARNGARSGLACVLLTSLIALVAAGCGGGSSSSSSGSGTGPIKGETTTVAIQLSSAANDQFVQFAMSLNSISLTNQAGVVTTIFNTPTGVEFIRANQSAVPLATVTVPQDVYTSAAVTLSGPSFTYIFMAHSGSITTSTDAYGDGKPPYPPVVNMAGPITVEGSTMGLLLSLDAAKSGTVVGFPNQTAYSITPTFTLSSFGLSSATASAQNGRCAGLAGQISAIDNGGQSVSVTLPGSRTTGNPTLKVALNSSTVYQGISGGGDLKVGMLVNMDAALQADASYAATRIEVQDPEATDVAAGQLMDVYPDYNGYIMTDAVVQAGTNVFVHPLAFGTPYMYGTSGNFQISARFPAPDGLPFTPDFSAASVFPGQMVALGSTTLSLSNPYTAPTTVTLLPQTVDAVVSAESTSGSFDVYTAQLAPYDLIVQMNNPPQGTPGRYLQNAGLVYIYVNSATVQHASGGLSAGGTFRFHGFLFNDGGVLRMVCDQVDDGVAQ